MPRLGEDPNVATAYPNRHQTNLRGSCLRQLLTTALSSLLLVFVIQKVILSDYKDATKKSMKERGMADKIDDVIPKTIREKKRDAIAEKLTTEEKIRTLHYEVGNLTNSVIELQEALKNTGMTLRYPAMTLPEADAKAGGEAAKGEGQPANGDGGNGAPPALGLRGAKAVEGELQEDPAAAEHGEDSAPDQAVPAPAPENVNGGEARRRLLPEADGQARRGGAGRRRAQRRRPSRRLRGAAAPLPGGDA